MIPRSRIVHAVDPKPLYLYGVNSKNQTVAVPGGSVALSVTGFGAKGDGVTDDTAAIQAAVVDAGEAGAIITQADYSVASQIDPGAGGSVVLSALSGLLATITKAASGVAGAVYMFSGRTRLHLKNLRLYMDPDPLATNTANLINWNHDNIHLEDVVADGGVVLDGDGVRNSNTNIALVSTGTRSGLSIFKSKFSRFFWGFLKGNTTVSTETNITVAFSEFEDMGSTYLLFNSPAPGAATENVLIIGNTMGDVLSRQPFGASQGFPHRGSFAGHVTYTRLIGNHATGYGGEFFRAEEAARASVWIGNTAKLDGKDGIEIIPNNAGGTVYTPTLFAIGNNVLENTGLVSAPAIGWGIGLHVYTSVSGLADAECIGESTVHDNVSKGWGQALQVHQGAQRNLIHHNVLADSDEGIKTWSPSLGMHDNLISDCTTALVFEAGGLMGQTHFRSVSATPAAQTISVVTGPGGVVGWTWESGRRTIVPGSTFVELVDIGVTIDAQITVSISYDVDDYTIETGRLVYDGSSLSYFRQTRKTSGNVILSSSAPFGIKNGHLTLQVFSGRGTDASGVRLSVALDGLHIWS